MQHEVTNGRDPMCHMKAANGWDPICNMKLPMVGTLYAT